MRKVFGNFRFSEAIVSFPLLFLTAILLLSGIFQPLLAVQSHEGKEGLISHQVGHFLYLVGIIYILVHSLRARSSVRAWRHFRLFLLFLIIWNILTFTGHWLATQISSEKLVKVEGLPVTFIISSFSDAIFYLSRFDHLLLIPSLIFLLCALKKWRAES